MSLDPTILRTLLREMLERRRRELRTGLDRDLTAAERPAGEVIDRKDLAAALTADTLAEAETRREADELATIDGALARLRRDDFCRCDECGAPIGQARLLALPTARRCTACQLRHEPRRTAC